ncbi:hypothetical protein PCE1_004097 [Barthelona sp. PCE]
MEQIKQYMQESEYNSCIQLINAAKAAEPIIWSEIEDLPESRCIGYNDLKDNTPEFSKIAMVRLNGGLGTSMGCTGPKSVLPVQGTDTFLDIIIQQMKNIEIQHNTQVPLILLNSFNTHEASQEIIQKYPECDVRCVLQSRMPRLNPDMTPVPVDNENNAEWYPPGHGDVFRSLHRAGVIDSLIEEGREYIFIANVDNLGSTLNPRILGFLQKRNFEFMMETTPKSLADLKGGMPIFYRGKLKQLETAQVPKEHMPDFCSISKFPVFNTNNLWVHLPSLKAKMDVEDLQLDIIFNPKKLEGKPILQLEQAMGAAIGCFEDSAMLVVPRTRFLPVKTSANLMLLRSSLFVNDPVTGALLHNPNCQRWKNTLNPPIINLSKEFKFVNDYEKRISSVMIEELDHLTVSGDVIIEKDAEFVGTVIIVLPTGTSLTIPKDRYANCVITVDPFGQMCKRDL